VTRRREFFKKVAASGAAFAAISMDPFVAAAQAGAGEAPPQQAPPQQGQVTAWDDTWATALANAKYKAVIDGPEVEDGTMFWYAAAWLDGCKQALNAADGEAQAAIVIRHAAISLAYGDAIWSKYELGKRLKIKDPATTRWAVRNPYLSVPEGNTEIAWMTNLTLTALNGRGVSFPCCNRATRFLASQIAGWSSQERNVVYEELKANLVPGARLQPTGIYAVLRAQQVGAAFLRS
jgi:intracellular sulfur oxidation DsrE/DsrF family protein